MPQTETIGDDRRAELHRQLDEILNRANREVLLVVQQVIAMYCEIAKEEFPERKEG